LAGEHEVEIPPAAALDEEEPAEYGPLELDPIEPAGKEAAARDADAALEASGFEAPGAGKVAGGAASGVDEEAGWHPDHTADSDAHPRDRRRGLAGYAPGGHGLGRVRGAARHGAGPLRRTRDAASASSGLGGISLLGPLADSRRLRGRRLCGLDAGRARQHRR